MQFHLNLHATDVAEIKYKTARVPPQSNAHTCARHISGIVPLADFYDPVR